MEPPTSEMRNEIRITGTPVSPGVIIGPLVVINQAEVQIPERDIPEDQIPQEIARLETALLKTHEQIQQIKEHISSSIGEKDASIFEAHLLVVEDNSLVEAVKRQLALQKKNVEHVYHHLMTAYAKSMRELDDPYLQERAADLLDVGRRVLNNLSGADHPDSYQLIRPSIILSHDLSPSDTALLDRSMVLAFATDVGSPTSHTAIMARSLNIPAVVGLKDATTKTGNVPEALLDGYQGLLILNPSEQTKFEYGALEKQRHEVETRLDELRGTQAVTTDHRRILVAANVELPEDLPLLEETGAEGIGLYRTEFLFLNRTTLPSEEEQYEAYLHVIRAAGTHGAIIRTIDLGGDKMPENVDLGDELNPFLGWRAIRYCLDQPIVFQTQLRAILRAAHGLNAKLMFPMIATLDELLRAKEILHQTQQQLAASQTPHAEKIEFGIMIEIPAAAIMVDHFVDHVDFFSIGTNDLVGYTMAVDRTNERVSSLYQPAHPAIIRMIRQVAQCAHQKGKWVGVCGEAAAEVLLTPMFVGLGIDELSMGSIFIPRVKKAVQSLNFQQMEQLVNHLANCPTSSEIEQQLREVAMRAYPELLI